MERDPQLWELAQRRASFKYHLGTYVLVNIFFWVIWLLNGDKQNDGLPWPVWPMLGWGIGLLFHFLGAYVFPKQDQAEKEYDKLINKKNQP